jgi:hypothetical protein
MRSRVGCERGAVPRVRAGARLRLGRTVAILVAPRQEFAHRDRPGRAILSKPVPLCNDR